MLMKPHREIDWTKRPVADGLKLIQLCIDNKCTTLTRVLSDIVDVVLFRAIAEHFKFDFTPEMYLSVLAKHSDFG